MKSLLTSWTSCAGIALRKSSVDIDAKIDIMRFFFCLILFANVSQDEIEMKFQSLCEQLVIGIQNAIQSHTSSSKSSVNRLGHGVCAKEELEVSCLCENV